jgi:hypothetical protein
MGGEVVRSDMGKLAAELSHWGPTPVNDVDVVFHIQSSSILAELDGVEWGRTPIYLETFSPYGDVK